MSIIYIVIKDDVVSPIYVVDWYRYHLIDDMAELNPKFLYKDHPTKMAEKFGKYLIEVWNVPTFALRMLEAGERQMEMTEKLRDKFGLNVIIVDQTSKRTTSTYDG